MARPSFHAAVLLLAALGVAAGAAAPAEDVLPEFRLKAAFLYNFALFTEWPAQVGPQLNLCIAGPDPFGGDLEPLAGKAVGERRIVLHRQVRIEELRGCQLVYIPASALANLPQLLRALGTAPALTVADSPDALLRGVALTMTLAQSRVTFAADLAAARGAGLVLSSKLLRLATQVHQ